MEMGLMGRDLYLQVTDPQGNVHKNYHRVWDRDLFIKSQENYWDKQTAKARDEKTLVVDASVHAITEDEYKK